MPTSSYLLLFLLGLVAMVSTITTADKTGGSALDHPSQMLTAFPSRSWARNRYHKSKSIQRSVNGRAPDVGMEKLKHRGSRRTMEKLEEKARGISHVAGCLKNVDGTRPAGCLPRARKDIVEKNVGREMPENRPGNEPVFFLRGAKKSAMQKLDRDAMKDKRTGYRTKLTSNMRRAEDMHN